MGLRNSAEAWGWPARVLHWAMAALILFMLGLGYYMAEFVDDMYVQFDLVQTHKSWGFVAFVMALVRLGWRFVGGAAPAGVGSGLMRAAAAGGHLALYALIIALPVTGWLMVSASDLQEMYGIRNMVFGLFEMPDPYVPGDKAVSDFWKEIHHLCGFALSLLVIGHAAVALKHHFVDRDEVLKRMTRG